jgi:hypothetical protein
MSAAGFNPYAGYNAAADRFSGSGGENAAGRYERWLRDARNIAAQRGFGTSGFNWGSYGPDVFANTYNPGEAIENIVHGTVPQHAGVWGTPGQSAATTTSMYDFLGRQLDPTQQLFYQTNPQLAYAYGGTVFSPNAASPRRDWWDQNWGQFNAEYGNASVDNPNLQITDFLNQRFPQMAQAFDLLPAVQRGVNSPFLPAGRPQL